MKRGYRAHSRYCDYFVRLYALNHPVGFLSRVDGSRSRIKACGLLRASIMTQSTIRLTPTRLLTTRISLSFFPFFLLLYPPFSLYLAKIIRSSISRTRRPRRQEICGFSRDRLLCTVSSVAIFFNLFPAPLYLCFPVPLLPCLLLCDRDEARRGLVTSAALTRAFA